MIIEVIIVVTGVIYIKDLTNNGMYVFRLRADAHNRLFVYSESYITCTHLVPIERLVVLFYLTFIQVGNIGFCRGTGELFKTELTAYITCTYTFSTTFYSLLTSLKSYELTA